MPWNWWRPAPTPEPLARAGRPLPVTTHDVDIVHSRSPENLDRLVASLASMNACGCSVSKHWSR